ncbi:TetR/AcrR family transcriptional regulator [Bradyrhizobium sp. URHD0069]|jgi:AcrR family transcriptional regulator|uniref:TetR/AcrR family transcriptional regulator n=1 Tax=Bradyrhizobium sp. URHD0069 TaxID=1380355 RepID=UPI0004972E46|nr:TetR/AcrR family transcriptional regulator [Bradyrhizobium sp. URHD0069]
MPSTLIGPKPKRGAVRSGRPPRELAGEVETRILDAAHRVFLEHGLAGASIDEIASVARAGKPTIYARFATKEALFAAVVMRNVVKIADAHVHVPDGANIEERLADVGAVLLQRALASDNTGLMRLAIAEARRFPDLASSVHRQARERGVDAVARLLGEVAQSNELGTLPAFAPERLETTTRFFLDLVLLPLLIRALFGEKLKTLQEEIQPHVAQSVAFFLAACRTGGVT